MSIDLYTEDRLVYQFYPVTSNQISFKIKAAHDAHIILAPAPFDGPPCYEIFFGGWGNTKSVIRKNKQQPDVVEVATPQILNNNEYRGFWIRWEYGVISAGVQNDPNPILRYEDPQLVPIQHFGVCTGWGASGHWLIDVPAPGGPPGFQAPGSPGGYPAPASMGYPAPASMGYPQPGFNPGFVQPGMPPSGMPPSGMPPSAPGGYGMPTMAPRWLPSSNGSVPPTAVVAGNDVNGEPMYVARANHEGALLPGKLVKSHGVAYVAWGGRENPKNEYEILCDCSPRWVPHSGGQMPPGAFIGGQTETGETLYVGRAHHEGSVTPGKVQPSHGACYIPFGGNEVSKSQYELMFV